MFRLFVVGLVVFLNLWSVLFCKNLTEKNIYPNMEEIFKYHVEYKKIDTNLIKRSLKLYINQFDHEKIYLTEEEVSPFVNPSQKLLNKILNEYSESNFSEFKKIDLLIQNSIERSRKWRSELERELILASNDGDNNQSNLEFAKNESSLKKRLKIQLQNLLKIEKEKLSDPQNATLEQKEKIFSLWEKRFRRLEKFYQSGPTAENNFCLHLLKALAKSLDAHTAYFSEEEAASLRASLEKEFDGVGVILREGIDGVVIDSLVPGSPAEKSGKIQKGDFLIEVNGESTKDADYDRVLDMLRKRDKAELNLRFKRLALENELFSVALKPQRIIMENERFQYSLEPFKDGVIGKFILPSFYEGSDGSSCERDIKQSIEKIRKENKLLGVVLDFRKNSGGFLNQAVKTSGLFISNGVVVISKYANNEIRYLRTIGEDRFFKEPLIILSSKASASAAEIVAQALQDYGVALIVGDDRTYGKGSIQHQTVTNVKAENFFKVTVGKYYTVSGKSTQIDGVIADIIVPTEFFMRDIGERYLEYSLKRDFVTPAYMDPLVGISPDSLDWFEKNYLPNLQKRDSTWSNAISILKRKSEERTSGPKFREFLDFVREGPKTPLPVINGNRYTAAQIDDDPPMTEAINIMKDMIDLN